MLINNKLSLVDEKDKRSAKDPTFLNMTKEGANRLKSLGTIAFL